MLPSLLFLALLFGVIGLLPAQPVVLRVPKVCADALYTYALVARMDLEDAKAKVLALQRGEPVMVGSCTVQIED